MIKYLILFLIILVLLLYFMFHFKIIKIPFYENIEKFKDSGCYVAQQGNLDVNMNQCKIYYADNRDTCDSYPELYKLTILQLDILLTLTGGSSYVQYNSKNYDISLINSVKADKLKNNINDGCGFTPDGLYEIKSSIDSRGTVNDFTYEGKRQFGCFLPLKTSDISDGNIKDSILNKYGDVNRACIDDTNKTPITNIKCVGTNCPVSNDFHVITNFDNIENTYNNGMINGEIFLKIYNTSNVAFVKYNNTTNKLITIPNNSSDVKNRFDNLYEIQYINPTPNTSKYPRYAITDNKTIYSDGTIFNVMASSGENVYKIFDNDKTSIGWNTTSTRITEYVSGYPGEFLKFDLGENIVLKNFTLHPNTDNINRSPKNFRIYATNNDSSYNNLKKSDIIITENGVTNKDPKIITTTEYNYYEFTNVSTNNSIRFLQDTECDILIVGGGGAGTTGNGGGSSGGVLYYTNVNMAADTYTITVGSGGKSSGANGTPSRIVNSKLVKYGEAIGGNASTTASGASGSGTNSLLPSGITGTLINNEIAKTGGNDINSIENSYYGIDAKMYDGTSIISQPVINNPSYYYYAFTSTTGTNSIKFTKNTICDVLIVGGGGAGGVYSGGGGGGGGVIYTSNVNISPGTYPIIVGAGGIGLNSQTTQSLRNGQFSSAFGAKAYGGGGGLGKSSQSANSFAGITGGSGSGAKSANWQGTLNSGHTGGTVGNNSSELGNILISGLIFTNYKGNVGGNPSKQLTTANFKYISGGGGGAGSAGQNGFSSTTFSTYGNGGDGIPINITGTTYYWAGGGGAGGHDYRGGQGGLGGAGGGVSSGSSANGSSAGANGLQGINLGIAGFHNNINSQLYAGSAGNNTGSGGGGIGEVSSLNAGNGGSGIVIIRVQATSSIISSGGGGGALGNGLAPSNITKPDGGNGIPINITGVNRGYAGGGGGFNKNSSLNGTAPSNSTYGNGGNSLLNSFGNGNNGIVIIRWRKSINNMTGWNQIYEHSPGSVALSTSYNRTLINSSSYRYYAMVVRNNWIIGGNTPGCSISELELYGYEQAVGTTINIEPPAIYAKPTSTTKEAYLFIFDKNNKIKEVDKNNVANFSLKDNFKIGTNDISDKLLNSVNDTPAYGKTSRLISQYINSKNNNNMTLNLEEIDAKIVEYNADTANIGTNIPNSLTYHKNTIFNDIDIRGLTFQKFEDYSKLYNGKFYMSNDNNIYIKL